MRQNGRVSLRMIAVVAVMAALSAILQMAEFSVPFVPSFLKFDFSDLPALLASFAISPLAGLAVELVKNLVHLPLTHTGGVGELANFIVGVAFVFPAGLFYRFRKTKRGAIVASLVGTIAATAMSFPVNYFITYPFYAGLMGGMENIVGMYHAIFPSIDTLPKALLAVNCPFTFIKGIINVIITLFIYKPLSPILKGKK